MALALGGYESLAGQMMDLYGEAELVMLGRVSKRLARGVTTPGWTERKYAETAAARMELSSLMDRLSKQRRTISGEAVNTAYSDAQDEFLADLVRNARDFGNTVSAFHGMRVAEILADLNRRMDAADRSILRCANDAYADAIAHVSALTATGTITTREAVGRACADLADKGILSFTDERGRRWQMDTYAEMATLTALNRAAIEGYTDRMTEFGYDLAIISSHEGACPICAAWQGVVVSVSGGTRGYPSLAEAEAAGVFHPRCIHHISIWREGITPGEGRREPREIEEPSVPYTERSRQRYIERTIRKWKRRQAAATDATGEREARAYVEKWQRSMREHLAAADTTLLRQYYREGCRVLLSAAAKELAPYKIRELQKKQKNDKIKEIKALIRSEATNKKINAEKQNRHIPGARGFDQTRSYLFITLEEAQKLVDRYHGTGELKFTKKGEWSGKEVISLDSEIGVNVSKDGKMQERTNRFTIHYSKTGTHIVPTNKSKKD